MDYNVITNKSKDNTMNTLDKGTIRAVIFDLDGTLIDTEKIYRVLWPAAMKTLGHTFTEEQYLQLRSLGRPYSPAKFAEWYGPEFDYDLARKIRGELFNEHIRIHGIDRKPGAIELLNYLRDNGIVTAIATATDYDRATRFLDMTELSGYFDRVISATMVDEGKPSPKVYQYACSELGFAPNECVAVEDAPNGILSAYRAGLNVIMVPDQSDCTDELRPLIFDCVSRLDKICDIIK